MFFHVKNSIYLIHNVYLASKTSLHFLYNLNFVPLAFGFSNAFHGKIWRKHDFIKWMELKNLKCFFNRPSFRTFCSSHLFSNKKRFLLFTVLYFKIYCALCWKKGETFYNIEFSFNYLRYYFSTSKLRMRGCKPLPKKREYLQNIFDVKVSSA